jgi:hypothetical protein
MRGEKVLKRMVASYIYIYIYCIAAMAHARDPIGFVDMNVVTAEFTRGRSSLDARVFKTRSLRTITFTDVSYLGERES